MSVKAEQREFNAEVRQLLDIVVHSLYSNKDIFLRELISNASDALDKLRFESLTNAELLPEEELHIRIERDPAVRTISVVDNGIGMTRAEMVENLGTIAKSGTAEFLEAAREGGRGGEVPSELIGQFGVGFYSSFMVADRVTVVSRKVGTTESAKWESDGEGSYRLSEGDRDRTGTIVTLHLKSVDGEAGIKDYTDQWVARDIIKRYSDFVSYPIKMQTEVQEPETDDEGKPKGDGSTRTVTRDEVINSMKAIWSRPADEVTDDEYKEFYKHITHDWHDSLEHIHTRLEGTLEARALLYVPAKAPMDLYYREMSYRGLQLYVKRVFIMDECQDLMPVHLRFIKGIVDAEDLSLNVSRELLQQDRQITAIRKFLVRKIMDTLKRLKQSRLEEYIGFWKEFGPVLKEGLLSWEEDKKPLLDLMLVASSDDPDRLTSLEEYINRMRDGQDIIYYMTGPSLSAVRSSPQAEVFLEKGYEVLFFTDPVDEVWLQHAPEYQEKKWKSVGRGDVSLGSEDDRKKAEEDLKHKTETHKDLLSALHKHLEADVKEIRLTNRLTTSAACLVSDEHDIAAPIAEMLRRAGQDVPVVKQTLELNPQHSIVQKLQERFAKDAGDPVINDYATLLYGQAILAEGGQLSDPAAFSKLVADLMAKGL